jgi:hypothetical protein
MLGLLVDGFPRAENLLLPTQRGFAVQLLDDADAHPSCNRGLEEIRAARAVARMTSGSTAAGWPLPV